MKKKKQRKRRGKNRQSIKRSGTQGEGRKRERIWKISPQHNDIIKIYNSSKSLFLVEIG